MIALAVVYALICGLCFRLRGSALWDIWTGSGTTGGRIQYAATAALLLAALKVDMHLLALGPALWLGCVLPWWNHGLVPRDAESFAANASRGVFWLLPCAPVLWWAGYDGWGVLLVAGAFSGPIYALANRLRFPSWNYVRYAPDGTVADVVDIMGPGTALAEFLYGCYIGAVLFGVVTY